MLVLSRKVGEEVIIAGQIKVTVCRIDGNQVRLGFQAPAEIHIVRGELKPLEKARPVRTRKKPVRAATTPSTTNSTAIVGPTAGATGLVRRRAR